jgi:hypothetical protein
MKEELDALARDHVEILRNEDLVTDRVPIIMEAKDGTILEVFEWKSAEAIEAAHSNPNVLAMWERNRVACDYIPVAEVPEAVELFSEFEPF